MRADAYPVTPGHALIIPRRHVENVSGLTIYEWQEILFAIDDLRESLGVKDLTIAINDGRLAGRTIHHLHVHVIPRRAGDVADPRGGVRRLFYKDDDPWLASRAQDWWLNRDCAQYLDLSYSSWSAYVSRGEAPPPDRMFGRSPAWRPETVKAWAASRRQPPADQ